MAKVDPAEQRAQLTDQRHKVDFDSYDVTVDELVRRVGKDRIEIAPAYQRQFRWDSKRQSRLIESLLLGIPVPSLFMATNVDQTRGTTWEVVDGLQRLLSLVNFLGDPATRAGANLDGDPTSLTDLDKLTLLEGYSAKDLPTDILTGLEDRPIKVIVLNDKSDLRVRFDLFERLNTGGIRLTDHEVRECVYMGEFINLLDELAQTPDFKTVVRITESQQRDGTAQEYVLRFFAFLERYAAFDHSVKDFLNDFCADAATTPRADARRKVFSKTFSYLATVFPDGLKSRKGTTAVNLFEGISVGAALALQQDPSLAVPTSLDWVTTDEIKKVTTGATNNRASVSGRVKLSRDHFLAGK
ncbi:DUF262 domain-containing protein [Microbacterium sp. CFBP 8794]|uniref:DUF262 domain-containing protein n=1 Tax=Microbacterium sp. CFBP 8794 TaxID=2775269 RepID=UPI00177E6BF4|nr:DUF262 domain-containing protein [Microbacterium sp. CFBP 8794]MBD8477697.1 DUF262 domain-containing protein [Microbacterium sp. CFBP 8794]